MRTKYITCADGSVILASAIYGILNCRRPEHVPESAEVLVSNGSILTGRPFEEVRDEWLRSREFSLTEMLAEFMPEVLQVRDSLMKGFGGDTAPKRTYEYESGTVQHVYLYHPETGQDARVLSTEETADQSPQEVNAFYASKLLQLYRWHRVPADSVYKRIELSNFTFAMNIAGCTIEYHDDPPKSLTPDMITPRDPDIASVSDAC